MAGGHRGSSTECGPTCFGLISPGTSRRKNGSLAERGPEVRGLPRTSEPHSGMEEPSLSRGEGVEASVSPVIEILGHRGTSIQNK